MKMQGNASFQQVFTSLRENYARYRRGKLGREKDGNTKQAERKNDSAMHLTGCNLFLASFSAFSLLSSDIAHTMKSSLQLDAQLLLSCRNFLNSRLRTSGRADADENRAEKEG
jgi:hypothetical protein